MAETFTDNLKLSKRDTGDLNWGSGANSNLDVIDQQAQLKALRPPRSLLASLGSGGVGANLIGSTTYFYKITAVNELGETTENNIPSLTEAQITEPASPVPIILSWETVPGATGYKIYKGTSANSELLLAQIAGGATATFTDIGNTATQAGQNVPTLNTALLSVTGVRKQGEAAPLRGDVKLEAGPNIVLTQDPAANKIKIEATSSGGVTSVRKEGEPSGLAGDVKLRAGTNIALTQDAVGNAIEIVSTASGGQSPYIAVVASPTGVAATDKANIQAALDSVPVAGGTIILKQGTYVIDSFVTPKANTVIVGQGIRATVINQNVDGIIFGGAAGSDVTIRDLSLTGTSAVTFDSPTILNPTTAVHRWKFIRVRFFGLSVCLSPNGVWTHFLLHTCEIDLTTVNTHFQIQGSNALTGGWFVVESCKFDLSSNSTIRIDGFATTQENGGHHQFKNNVIDSQGGVVSSFSLQTFYAQVTGNYFRFNLGSATNVIRVNGTQNIFSDNNILNQGAGLLNIFVAGSNNILIGNNIRPAGSSIILDSAVTDEMVVGNKCAVTNNSASPTNIVASNFVSGLRKFGETSALAGDVKLKAGSNIALTQDGPGNAIEIATTGGGGVTSLRKFGEAAGLTGDVKIDQGSDITVTQDAPNNKLIVAYSGTKGYTTVIAPAPTGTNDTTNLQAALDAIPSGVGGRLILREGVYIVDTLNLQRSGTRLVGSGSGVARTGEGGTQIRSSGFSGDILRVKANGVLIENITFNATQLPDGFAIISGDPNIQITGMGIHHCLLGGIRSPLDGIRIPLVFFLNITNCQFWMDEVAAQSVSRTPNAIKIGPTTFGFSLDEIRIANCMFRINYPSPTAGTITAKAIDLTKVKSAVIANCQALGINSSANRIYIFTELKQDASIGSNAVIKGNSLTGFSQLIKQTGAFPKVSVGDNVFTQPGGADPAIDLASGNTEWAITGNVLEGTTGINLQAGANNNVVANNVAAVVNSGTGNSFGGQSPFTAVVAAPTGIAATDTANIQNAINSLGTVGGTVVLKEGNYNVNQISLNKDGLRLVGAGSGWSDLPSTAIGTRISGVGLSNAIVSVTKESISIENISFDGVNGTGGFPIIDVTSSVARNFTVKSCSFVRIRASTPAAIKSSGAGGLRVLDSLFYIEEPIPQSTPITTVGIKVNQPGGSGSTWVKISRCLFKFTIAASSGVSVIGKGIEISEAFQVIISDCQAFGAAFPTADETYMFAALNITPGTGKGIVIKGNTGRFMHHLIKQTGSGTKVAVSANNHIDHKGSGSAIDLSTGNTAWSIIGNVLEGTTGINLQTGADNNVVIGNVANVANSGTGNSVANNVAP